MLLLLAPFVLLTNAHAHNDYEHPHPLFDALDNGYLSVEADIFLVDGELQVGHSHDELRPGRTLESLYLDPLAARVKANRGTVYGQKGVLTLLVECKDDGATMQPAILAHLAPYRAMLSERHGKRVRERAVRIVLTGRRTEDCAADDGVFFKDGTLKNMADDPWRTPQISDAYPSMLGSFASPLSPEGHARLLALVAQAHANGKRLRLWAAPDKPATWGELRDAGVDLLNTDRLADLRAFLITGSAKNDGFAPRIPYIPSRQPQGTYRASKPPSSCKSRMR